MPSRSHAHSPHTVASLPPSPIGVDFVFDVSVARSLALLECQREFIARVRTEGAVLPLLTSACPGWICYAEKSHGDHVLPYIRCGQGVLRGATQAMAVRTLSPEPQATIAPWADGRPRFPLQPQYRQVAAADYGHPRQGAFCPSCRSRVRLPAVPRHVSLDLLRPPIVGLAPKAVTLLPLLLSSPAKIYLASVMPCYDKKLEASRDDFYNDVLRTRDVDCVIATGELETMLQENHIDLAKLAPSKLDSVVQPGVTEAPYGHPGSGSVRRRQDSGGGGGGRERDGHGHIHVVIPSTLTPHTLHLLRCVFSTPQGRLPPPRLPVRRAGAGREAGGRGEADPEERLSGGHAGNGRRQGVEVCHCKHVPRAQAGLLRGPSFPRRCAVVLKSIPLSAGQRLQVHPEHYAENQAGQEPLRLY